MHQLKHTLRPQQAILGIPGINFSPWQSSTTTQRTILHSIVNRQDFSMVVYHITYSIINSDIMSLMSLKQSNEECKQSSTKPKRISCNISNIKHITKASVLDSTDYGYILNPEADNQTSKILFRDFKWIGPYKVEKDFTNSNYIARRLGTNKTHLLHRIRLRKFTPQAPLADTFVRETNWKKYD